ESDEHMQAQVSLGLLAGEQSENDVLAAVAAQQRVSVGVKAELDAVAVVAVGRAGSDRLAVHLEEIHEGRRERLVDRIGGDAALAELPYGRVDSWVDLVQLHVCVLLSGGRCACGTAVSQMAGGRLLDVV